MARVGQELIELGFAQERTQMAGGVLGYDPEKLDIFTKTFEAYEKELKRVFGSLVTTVSEIDDKTKQAVRKVYIPREYEQEALGVRKSVFDMRQGLGIDDTSVMYATTQNAHFIEAQKEIKGAKAQQFAREEVLARGGTIRHVAGTSNKDMMIMNLPVTDTDLSTMKRSDITRFVTGSTPEANKASRAEQSERNKRERDLQMERDAKLQQRQFRENQRETEKKARQAERDQKEKEKQEEKEIKDKIQSRKETVGKIGKIIATIGVLIDITRRILTSVIAFGQQTSQLQSKANTLNTGLADARALSYLDTALNLDKGTNLQAQEDFRQAFGNPANLNTEALKWLAMVMGDKAGNAVQMGLGRDNPSKLVEMSLDAFFERWQEGKDQFDNQVGQDKARRALVTVLEQVSPAIARIFERMVEEQTSGIHAGEVTSYRQLQSFYLQGTGGLDPADLQQIKLLGDETASLKATFQQLADTIKGSVLIELGNFIGKLNNLHIGQTSAEATAEDLTDLEWLSKRQSELEGRKQNIESKMDKVFRKFKLPNKSIDEVMNWAQQEVMFDTTPIDTYYINTSKDAMEFIMSDPALYEEMRMYYAILAMQKKVEDYSSGSNPNADRVALGDTELIRMKKRATFELDRLGMGNPYSIVGSEYDFDFNSSAFMLPEYYYDEHGVRHVRDRAMSAEERQDYIESNPWILGMFKTAKYAQIYRASDEFFEKALDPNIKSSKYHSAFVNALANYNKLNETKLSEEQIKQIYDKMSNPLENENVREEARKFLANLFLFGASKSDVTGMKNKSTSVFQTLLQDIPDEYGLTAEEYENIQAGIELGKVRVSKTMNDSPTMAIVSAGDTSGTLRIVLAKEEDGIIKELLTTSVQATMNEGFEKTINLDTDQSIIDSQR